MKLVFPSFNKKIQPSTVNAADYTVSQSYRVAKTAENKQAETTPAKPASDILLRQIGPQYQIGYWKNGTSEWKSSNVIHTDTWELLGSFDMNGDGKGDLVAVGAAGFGAEKIKYVGYYRCGIDNAENWVTIGSLVAADEADWKIKVGNLTGKKNFNSIVWYSAPLGKLGVWLDGTTEWTEIPGAFGEHWTMIGCGDFDGNGKESVLMSYDNGTRYFAVALDGTLKELGSIGPEWKVVSITDLDGKGKDDILFFHEKLGLLVKWADGKPVQLGQLDVSDWMILGCGSYSGSRGTDLLVQQISTRLVGYFASGSWSRWHTIGTLHEGWQIVL